MTTSLPSGQGAAPPTRNAPPTTGSVSAPGVIPLLPPIAGLVPPGAETRRANTSTPIERRGVAVFGDSLVIQAWSYVQHIAADRGQPFDGGAYGGTALCDWMPGVDKTLSDGRPAYLVLAFVGNNLTPCTLATDGSRRFGAALVALYRRDAQRAITAARAVGTQVFVLGPPAMKDPALNDNASSLGAAMRELAAINPGVVYLDANAILSPEGYRPARPCLSFETATLGCQDGSIVIRSADGVHLETPGGGDGAYSAGAWRYATLLMRGIRNAS